jgi:phosphopantetheinyl transferase (holo-ACP synthase)
MTSRAVGNDIVDLLEPRTVGKVDDRRFLERILAESERSALGAAADPHGALWTHWAGKEAGYKVVSKLRGEPPVFIHRDFVVTDGRVEHEGVSFPLAVARAGDALHAVSCAAATLDEVVGGVGRLDDATAVWSGSREALVARLTPREADAVHSRASAAVRVAARAALAGVLGVAEQRLEIVCAPGVTGRRPPRVLLDGAPGPADVSLSHHGAWIAWAILAR